MIDCSHQDLSIMKIIIKEAVDIYNNQDPIILITC